MSIRQYCTVVDREESELPNSKRSRLDEAGDDSDSSSSAADGDIDEPEPTSHEGNSSVLTSTAAETSSTESSTNSAKRKQASKFCNDWRKGRELWLKYLPGQGMFCTLCQKHNKSPFSRGTWNTTPCTRLRLQSITAHEGCAAHKDALKMESEKLNSRTIQSAINPRIPTKGIEQAFTSLYFLAKQRIAHTTNFEPLLDLLGLLGLNVKSKIQIAKNALYTSDKAIQEMVFVISEVIETHILKEIRDSSHFALMLDETTDCTVTEQLVIHGRYIDHATGELKSHYLKVIDTLQPEVEALGTGSQSVSDVDTCISVCAQTITNRVCEYVASAELDMAKMRGIGTDGASTMMGCHSGVVARLKTITPSAIGVHCAAHRLNLASSQAGDSVSYVKRFSSILRQLYDFFDNSAVRTAGLEAVQTLISESGKLLAPCSTRWLSTERSVNRLRKCFISVVLSLQREGEERSDAKAVGLNNLVTEYRFVCTMLLLCDALPHVSHLSKCFQSADCDYSIIPRMVSSTVHAIKQLKTVDGVNMKGLPAFMEQITNSGIEIKKKSNLGDEYFKKSIRDPYLDNLISNIESRFDDKSVMASFDIYNPAKLPHLPDDPSCPEDLEAFTEYGNDDVENLARQFQGVVADSIECLEEWSSFRQFLKENCTDLKQKEVISKLCCDSSWAVIYPNMSTLAKVCRVVPIQTADVERTFSQLKLIKTRVRNRMNEKTLDSLLRIAIEGPPISEFPVTEAVKLWATKKNRRLSC